jgi:hypothetical protein
MQGIYYQESIMPEVMGRAKEPQQNRIQRVEYILGMIA